jgi:exodeoxyribonuclease VII large subunit
MMTNPVFSVSDAVAVINQTFDSVYPSMTIVGELANLNVSKNRWVYGDLKDSSAKMRLFGTVFQLPGPLENGMQLEIVGEPRLHPQFGFSLNIRSIRPVGEGSIKKAANLLQEKLEKEGLFSEARKRIIPYAPERVGLITSEESAAYADFIKILNSRWQGVDIELYNSHVQGESAVESLVSALNYFNQEAEPVDVIVMIRGGGSADDLSAFSSEQVVRSVATSRVPTVVAIGHEIDVSLAELAADLRASTPSNAAELIFPDKKEQKEVLSNKKISLKTNANHFLEIKNNELSAFRISIYEKANGCLDEKIYRLKQNLAVLESAHPKATLRRGFALIETNGKLVSTVSQMKKGEAVKLTVKDGSRQAKIE